MSEFFAYPRYLHIGKTFDVAKVLEYLKETGVIHSDIKAVRSTYSKSRMQDSLRYVQNYLLISSSGVPRICDFGISRILAPPKHFSLQVVLRKVQHDGWLLNSWIWFYS